MPRLPALLPDFFEKLPSRAADFRLDACGFHHQEKKRAGSQNAASSVFIPQSLSFIYLRKLSLSKPQSG
jgi:hypothetical protein